MLEELFGSSTRAAILKALLEDPVRPLHLRELVRRCGGSVSGAQREVGRLEQIGLLASEIDEHGRRQIYITITHPLVDPLVALIAAEARAEYAPVRREPRLSSTASERINPRIRGTVPAIVETSRAYGATRVALFGSSTQADPAVVPQDLDITVRFDSSDPRSRADLYFGLKRALERLTGMKVDLVEDEAIDNPYLRSELADSEEVLYEAS